MLTIYEENSEELDLEIKTDRRYAQIPIKITDSSRSDKETKKLIESLGVHSISMSRLSAYWVLFTLNPRNTRNAALRLTEHGFILKGINALPQI
jgi:hypothetical protein